MRLSAWCTKGALSALFILGLTQGSANASQANIVAVDGTLCDLTTTLVGDVARVTCLIPPGGNPHAYQLKPSDRQTLAGAALVVHNGFNLTPSVRKISSRLTPRKIDFPEFVPATKIRKNHKLRNRKK